MSLPQRKLNGCSVIAADSGVLSGFRSSSQKWTSAHLVS